MTRAKEPAGFNFSPVSLGHIQNAGDFLIYSSTFGPNKTFVLDRLAKRSSTCRGAYRFNGTFRFAFLGKQHFGQNQTKMDQNLCSYSNQKKTAAETNENRTEMTLTAHGQIMEPKPTKTEKRKNTIDDRKKRGTKRQSIDDVALVLAAERLNVNSQHASDSVARHSARARRALGSPLPGSFWPHPTALGRPCQQSTPPSLSPHNVCSCISCVPPGGHIWPTFSNFLLVLCFN